MSVAPNELREKAEQTRAGKKTSAKVRTLLDWFGAQRRRQGIVATIREALAEVGVRTEPDFEYAYIDERVSFLAIEQPVVAPRASEAVADLSAASGTESTSELSRADPTYRIGKLPSANMIPLNVKPDESIENAVTLMLQFDFSQLPVMTGPRDVKGMFSWRSLGSRLATGKDPGRVLEFSERHRELSSDTSLFEAIPTIIDCGCVLIRDHAKAICGIVTSADLSLQFRKLTEPFLLLNEVEDHIRSLVDGKFAVRELAESRDPAASDRPVARVADLTLGEYLRLLEKPDHWGRLQIQVSRSQFVAALRRVLDIRNDVMHFDPDGIADDELEELRRFVSFLQRIQTISRRN